MGFKNKGRKKKDQAAYTNLATTATKDEASNMVTKTLIRKISHQPFVNSNFDMDDACEDFIISLYENLQEEVILFSSFLFQFSFKTLLKKISDWISTHYASIRRIWKCNSLHTNHTA